MSYLTGPRASEQPTRHFNTYHADSVSRRHVKIVQNCTHFSKNDRNLEFGDYIWNHYGNAFKKVQSCLVCEIVSALNFENLKENHLLHGKTIGFGEIYSSYSKSVYI